MGGRHPSLVLRPVQSIFWRVSQSVSRPMTLLAPLAGLRDILLSGFLFAASGRFLLEQLIQQWMPFAVNLHA